VQLSPSRGIGITPSQELVPALKNVIGVVDEHIKDGRFQRSLALVTAASSLVSGLEVGYEHYKGSYSNPVMYTPLLMSAALTGSAAAGFFSRTAATGIMRWTSFATLVDGVIGFGFHIRGIQRKPGGWRIPIVNIVMGPPIFAPLLFGTAAYLGFMASYLRREEDPKPAEPKQIEAGENAASASNKAQRYTGWRKELREGKFQKHLCAVTALWTVFSGAEAWYSHYKSRFRIWAQWIPLAVAPLQLAASIGGIYSETMAERMLPATSVLTMVNGGVGFFYHARGIVRRPGRTRHWVYNILYGPPIFAPLLFSACGFLGLLASLLRREGRD
jgi:hypothetical protein